MRNNIRKINYGIFFKWFIFASLVFVFLFVVFGEYYLPDYLQENMYSISYLKKNINNIKVGDTLAYGINGHYSWEIIGIDKNSGMIEVVSKSDVAKITLEGGYTADYYSGVLQSAADTYNDGKYVVSSRSARTSDLSKFNYNSEFWLSDIDGNNIKTSTGLWSYNSDRNYKIYVYPVFQLSVDYTDDCYVTSKSYGDICDNHTVNGINRFIWVGDGTYVQWGKIASYLTPVVPLEISVDNASIDVNAKAKEIINSFPSFMSSSYNFFENSQSSDMERRYNVIRAFFDSQDEDAIIYVGSGTDNNCSRSGNSDVISCNSFIRYSAESKTFTPSSGQIYMNNKKTKGFRPILTLNLNVDGDLSNTGTNSDNNTTGDDSNSDSNNNSSNNNSVGNNDTSHSSKTNDSITINAVIPGSSGIVDHGQSDNDSENDIYSNNYISNSSHNNGSKNNSLNTGSKIETIEENKIPEEKGINKTLIYILCLVILLIIFLIALLIYTYINIIKMDPNKDVNKK